MTTTIRPAAESDIPAIAAIYGEAVVTGTATFEIDPPGPEEMGRRFAALREEAFPYLVAERAGVLAGYAYAGPYHQRAAYRSTLEDSVYVARDTRGSGVGRALLIALIAACEQIDARLLVAIIADSGSPASVALHASLGFSRVGAFVGVGHKHRRWLDTTLMQRPLGPGRDLPPTRV